MVKKPRLFVSENSYYLPTKLFHDPATTSTRPVKNKPVKNSDTIRNISPGLNKKKIDKHQ